VNIAVIQDGGTRCSGRLDTDAFWPFAYPYCSLEPAVLATAPDDACEADAPMADGYAQHLVAPVRPTALFCADDNYGDQPHPRRAGLALHRPDALRPFLTGAPIEDVLVTAVDPLGLRPSGTTVVRPRGCDRLDVGVSLAAVVGDPYQPRVVGYAVALDFMRLDVPQNQSYLARSFPTHKVISPALVTRDDFDSTANLRLTLRIDGETRQESTTAELIAGPDQLVDLIAQRYRLSSGDLVLTGSPAGRPSDHGGPWLEPGSVVEGEIEGLGTVTAHVEEELAPI
jgi:hypothetical protein